MKSLDELKGPRTRKKKRRSADTPASAPTPSRFKSHVGVPSRFKKPVGVPVMPRKGHDDSYELNYLYDTFDQ